MSTPLFVPTPNFLRGTGSGEDSTEKYLPNPSAVSQGELSRFEFVGCVMASACRYSGFCELDLPSLVWKACLGEQLGLRELQAVDAETASHLESVAAIEDEALWDAQGDPVSWSVKLVNTSVSAVRGDGSGLVSFSDKQAYVAAAEKAYLEQFQLQLASICKGFHGCFPQLAARLLTWRSLERRVCGVADVSVDALQRIANYEGSYSKGSDCECAACATIL
jgi:hypothetical protein